jgi:hypothetical protein
MAALPSAGQAQEHTLSVFRSLPGVGVSVVGLLGGLDPIRLRAERALVDRCSMACQVS